MRALHRAMMGVTLIALLAVAVGFALPSTSSALPQHGHADEAADHFGVVVERLGLSDAQRDALTMPFAEAFAAMETLHETHGAIAAELTDEQKGEFAEMMQQALGGFCGGEKHELHHGDSH